MTNAKVAVVAEQSVLTLVSREEAIKALQSVGKASGALAKAKATAGPVLYMAGIRPEHLNLKGADDAFKKSKVSVFEGETMTVLKIRAWVEEQVIAGLPAADRKLVLTDPATIKDAALKTRRNRIKSNDVAARIKDIRLAIATQIKAEKKKADVAEGSGEGSAGKTDKPAKKTDQQKAVGKIEEAIAFLQKVEEANFDVTAVIKELRHSIDMME